MRQCAEEAVNTMTQITGQCRCGDVQFEVTSNPLVTMACHCTGCQQMTSSAFSLSALYPGSRFRVTAGSPVLGGLRKEPRHYFCPNCMSWLFTRPMEDFVNVRATLMEDARTFTPFIEAYTDEKLPWAVTGAKRSFPRFPAEEDWPELIEAYAEHVAR